MDVRACVAAIICCTNARSNELLSKELRRAIIASNVSS
jgi:hypothetical protein